MREKSVWRTIVSFLTGVPEHVLSTKTSPAPPESETDRLQREQEESLHHRNEWIRIAHDYHKDLNYYTGNQAVCPKCGFTSITTQFRPASSPPRLYARISGPNDWNPEPRAMLPHIIRGCPNCKHEWFEKPLDAQEKEVKE